MRTRTHFSCYSFFLRLFIPQLTWLRRRWRRDDNVDVFFWEDISRSHGRVRAAQTAAHIHDREAHADHILVLVLLITKLSYPMWKYEMSQGNLCITLTTIPTHRVSQHWKWYIFSACCMCWLDWNSHEYANTYSNYCESRAQNIRLLLAGGHHQAVAWIVLI